ncbi:hypothetical protein AB6A40_008713 [Gnathostoma spinigerum]|uniref:Heparan-sulfate 6-O-sulfotransferase n=1 Tax=Gnathostoma spinigerum TaxID=75299 RepID=A0ABD6EPV2_9BILA
MRQLIYSRQTRMLADLTLINCYDSSQMDPAVRDKIMLESAKANLRNFAFFGLKERMSESQWMFEELFQMRFTKNLADWNKSKSNDTEITHHQLELIKKKNSLDVELYDFARKLFSKRLKRLKNERGNKFGNIVNSASIDMHDKVSQVGMPTVRLRDDPVVKENFSQSFTAGWLERVQGTADLKSTKNNEKLDSTSFFNREQQPQNYERVDPGSVDNSDEADSTDDNESFFPVRTSGTSRLQLFKF